MKFQTAPCFALGNKRIDVPHSSNNFASGEIETFFQNLDNFFLVASIFGYFVWICRKRISEKIRHPYNAFWENREVVLKNRGKISFDIKNCHKEMYEILPVTNRPRPPNPPSDLFGHSECNTKNFRYFRTHAPGRSVQERAAKGLAFGDVPGRLPFTPLDGGQDHTRPLRFLWLGITGPKNHCSQQVL